MSDINTTKENRVFFYNGDNEQIKEAIRLANNPAIHRAVLNRIANEASYDYSNCDPERIAYLYGKFMQRNIITVEPYYNKFTRAMGYFSSSKPKTINVNMAKAWNVYRLVSLFFHESGHSWDSSLEQYSVHHGSNSPIGKEKTFQYSLNEYVYDYFGYKKKPRKSLWRRVLSFLMGIKYHYFLILS